MFPSKILLEFIIHSELPSFWSSSFIRRSKNPQRTQRFGNWIHFLPQVRVGGSYSIGFLRNNYD
jgi:hypothetical protein